MARFTCSICSSPDEIRSAVDFELTKPEGARPRLRDLEKRCAFSRSALSRHARNCLSRRLLQEHSPKSIAGRRVVIAMDGKMFLPAGVQCGDESRTITDEDLHPESDLLIRVCFQRARVGNPSALRATQKSFGRNGVTFGEPELEIPIPPLPEPAALVPEPPQRQEPQSYATPKPENVCEHSFTLIGSGILRCQHCGQQRSRKQTVIGCSFAQRDALANRVKNH